MNREKVLEKIKGAAALVLIAALCRTQIFAAEPVSAPAPAVQGQQTAEGMTENGTAIMTVEDAVKRAKANSPDLREVQEYSEFLQATKEDLWDKVGYFDNINYDYKKWVNDGWYMVTSAAHQTESGMAQTKLNQQMAELAVEATVRSYFTSILSDQNTLELAEQTLSVQQTLYNQGKRKYELGFLSKYKLDQLEVQVQKAENSMALLQNTLEQEYVKFNDLIGAEPAERFAFVYEVNYAPYVMEDTMEHYITKQLHSDITIKMKELALDNAKFNMNYLPESSDGSKDKQNKLNYDQANRALKTAKEEKALAIRSGLLQLQQLETAYASSQIDLEKAKKDLHVAEVNLKAGNTTRVTVDQANLGVAKIENDMKQLEYQHDMQIFAFEHSSLLGAAK